MSRTLPTSCVPMRRLCTPFSTPVRYRVQHAGPAATMWTAAGPFGLQEFSPCATLMMGGSIVQLDPKNHSLTLTCPPQPPDNPRTGRSRR